MSKQITVKSEAYIQELTQFESRLTEFLNELGLPNENILVPLSERWRFIKNVHDSLLVLTPEQLAQSNYIAKFVSAVASWLFDAALNYLWNETINSLRLKVQNYNIKYFFDTLNISEQKRKELRDEADIEKITDDDLIKWARWIELITDLGYRELDNIRYMRNWASAAHPNNAELSAIKLLSYLETCLKEVISVETPRVAVQINKLFHDIKSSRIAIDTISAIADSLNELNWKQYANLVNWLFWIYIDKDSSSDAIENINVLVPRIMERMSDDIRYELWIKFANFKINNFLHEERMSKDFLKITSSLSFIPDNIRVNDIKNILDNLLNAHNNYWNFYSEPIFARQLRDIVGEIWVPNSIAKDYVYTLVEVFLTNWNWVARNADPIYRELIKWFEKQLAIFAITTYKKDEISSKLRYTMCQNRYLELLDMIEPKITDENISLFIGKIRRSASDLSNLWKNESLNDEIRTLRLARN